ncbi:MAG: hypothetical protein WAT33_12105, partial [Giesbergeria sp.]
CSATCYVQSRKNKKPENPLRLRAPKADGQKKRAVGTRPLGRENAIVAWNDLPEKRFGRGNGKNGLGDLAYPAATER